MKLYIDSANNLITHISLDDKNYTHTHSSPREQDVLSFIHQILNENQVSLDQLTTIEVKLGPGSFTGIRVGVSIANALGFALNLPINGGLPGEPVVPEYGQEPNITKKN